MNPLRRVMAAVCVMLLGAGLGRAAESADPRQTIVSHYDTLVPQLLKAQRVEPAGGDPNGIRVGEFCDTFNCRKQEGVYVLAYLYTEPRSKYRRDPEILRRVLLSLDYLCRAQGRNGGYNEYPSQGGWVGVALPGGGNQTRGDGRSSVAGFTFYCAGRSIVVLRDEPAFQKALDETMDHDGDGRRTVTRRQAYLYLVGEAADDGRLGGIAYLQGNGRGHAPNQDTGALAAVQALDEAFAVLGGGRRALGKERLEAFRDNVLFGRTSEAFPTPRRWFSDQGMPLESGRGDAGYDANYGVVTLRTLGAYAAYADDPVARAFIGRLMEGYQYFYVLDEAWPKGAYHESRTARRSPGPGGIPVFVAGLAQDCHPALAVLYAAGLKRLAQDPAPFFPSEAHLFQIESSEGVDLLLNWRPPKQTDYALPANRAAPFEYEDAGAHIKVVKTGRGPGTVTWTATSFDGGVKSYTYEAPTPASSVQKTPEDVSPVLQRPLDDRAPKGAAPPLAEPNQARVTAPQFRTSAHPRVFATAEEREGLLAKIRDVEWARRQYEELKARVDPLVERHGTDPEYVVSRLQMNWEEGKRHTRFWGAGNQIRRREGDAPFPTVRVAAGRVGTASRPGYDRLEPYGDGSLVMRRGGEWTRLPFEETGLGAEDVNMDILNDAYRAAVVYYFTGDRRYAKFAADIIWTVIRGASYQEQLNPDDPKHNSMGYLSYETLGDSRRYATIALTYDFVHDYLVSDYFTSDAFRNGVPGQRWAPPQPGGKDWALERVAVMFQKFIDNKLARGGGLQGNWNLNEQQSAILYALAMEDDAAYPNGRGREHYVSRLVYGPTTEGHGAYLDVAAANIDPRTGLWPEPPAGYGQGSIGQLVQFGYWYYHAGLDLLGGDPLIRKGAQSFVQMAFPNGRSTAWGDGQYATIIQSTAEYMVAYARAKGDKTLESDFTVLLRSAGNRTCWADYYGGLFFFVPELGAASGRVHYPRVSYSPVHSIIVGRSMGDTPADSLAYTVYGFGSKSAHRHRNGLSMELFGRGYVLGVDPGAGPNYWDPQHARYNNQVGAHNTVVPGGLAADHPMDLVINAAEPQPEPGVDPPCQRSTLLQFTDTSIDFEGKADQRRVMGIVRTSPTSGYYVDIFRSRMRAGPETTHDYLYHNMGVGLRLCNAAGELLHLEAAALDPKSGPGYDYFRTVGSAAIGGEVRADFDFGRDDITMRAWLLGNAGRTVYNLTGPSNFRYHMAAMRGLPVPTLLVRQAGEAWNRPFVVVYEPFGNGAEATIRRVRRLDDVPASGDLVGLSVEHTDESRELILSAADPKVAHEAEGVVFRGLYAVIMLDPAGKIRQMYLGAGSLLEFGGWAIKSQEGGGACIQTAADGYRGAGEGGAAVEAPDEGDARCGVDTKDKEVTP